MKKIGSMLTHRTLFASEQEAGCQDAMHTDASCHLSTLLLTSASTICYYFHSRLSESTVLVFWTSSWCWWTLGYSSGCVMESWEVLIRLRMYLNFNLLFVVLIYKTLWSYTSLRCYRNTKQLLLHYQTSCLVNITTLFCKRSLKAVMSVEHCVLLQWMWSSSNPGRTVKIC